jgi:hypothetical protein
MRIAVKKAAPPSSLKLVRGQYMLSWENIGILYCAGRGQSGANEAIFLFPF